MSKIFEVKVIPILFLIFFMLSCSLRNNTTKSIKKLEIIKTDTTADFYVFKTVNKFRKETIVIAEKDKVNKCQPFQKYIITDSVHSTYQIKLGNRFVFSGFYLSYIDDIKIRNDEELVKIIWNCNSFTNK